MTQEVTNFARFYSILKESFSFATRELGEEFKERVVSQFTDGRTTSLREMTRKEYDACCEALEKLSEHAKKSQIQKDELRYCRSVCLKLMQQAGIDTTDWARINDFCRNPRIAGKEFARLSAEELESLAVKLRVILRKGGLKARRDKKQTGALFYVSMDPGATKN